MSESAEQKLNKYKVNYWKDAFTRSAKVIYAKSESYARDEFVKKTLYTESAIVSVKRIA